MIDQMLFKIGVTVIWFFCGIATYRIIITPSDDDPADKFAAFLGSMAFWWFMLPIFLAVFTWQAAEYRYRQFQTSREKRPLQSGTENGLYDPVDR